MLKKTIGTTILSIILIIASGCKEQETTLDVVEVNLDVILNEFLIDENNEYTTISNDVTIVGNFTLGNITLLQNNYGEFPYVTEEINTDLEQFRDVISDLVDDLGDSQLSNENFMITRPKAKVSVSIVNEEYTIMFEFFQCADNNICSSSMTILNSDGNYVFNDIDDVASTYFDAINTLIN